MSELESHCACIQHAEQLDSSMYIPVDIGSDAREAVCDSGDVAGVFEMVGTTTSTAGLKREGVRGN